MFDLGTTGVLGAVSACLLAWACLAVGPTPVRWLWKPAVAATEWGHWLSAFSLLAGSLEFAFGMPGWVLVPAFAAAALFLFPLLAALLEARKLRERPAPAVWGPPGLRAPIVISGLVHRVLPRIRPIRRIYREIGGQALTLDLYTPPARPGAARRRTSILVVHGGSWNSGDSGQLQGMNRYLAGNGYTVAALNYRLAPRFRFPAPIEDIGAAVRFLLESRSDGGGAAWERVVLLGRSSGGHLALVAAYGPVHPAIVGVVALYAPTDLRWSWHNPAPRRLMDSSRLIRDFLGGSPDEVPARFEAASPIRLVRADVPSTLLIHGGNDEMVSPLQSRRLARELDRVGARCLYLELPWGKHGMDANLAGPAGQLTLYAVDRFLAALEGAAPREMP